ncbi:MAG TPA: HdeD family acid-resistance protein [Pseudonocardiaceae bacterium]|jgi:uncharacterized membrane protein HdeD (DUF308 family)|nr:HdeD family acid-resistance protein [Pseudonocardiaceae bacterium]
MTTSTPEPDGPVSADTEAESRSRGPADLLEGPLEGPLHRLARYAWQAVLLTGIAAIVLGVLVLLWPGVSVLVAGVLFGLYLVVAGIMQLTAAFGTHGTTSLRVLAFISGALSILLGLFCFRSALDSIVLLALWIGISWLFRGITQIVSAIADDRLPARGWQGFFGAISMLAGIVLIDSPFSSIGLLVVFGGAWLLALGVIEIITSFQIRSHLKQVS